MRILTVLGARPQFIKAAVVSRALDRWNADAPASDRITELIIHTGQHYDPNMSAVFFEELELRKPAVNLNVGSGLHGATTARMLAGVEEIVLAERPDWMLVYGDTNSTLAGALAAAKLHVPVAHVEAGLRSYNRRMPEEINRVLVDHVAELLLCPTATSVENLSREGIRKGVEQVGDVMFDASLLYRDRARCSSVICDRLGLRSREYVLATCHRAENTDDRSRLEAILRALRLLSDAMQVVLPLHPRTRRAVAAWGLEDLLQGPIVIEPLSYLDMIRLEIDARVVVTDSGGVQKEAFFFQVPCVTLRDETEWVETVATGWNRLVGAAPERIVDAVRQAAPPGHWPALYGDGASGSRIVESLIAHGRRRE
ncbi:MAG: UDP-N-acetylglucosamine 2-epimerase (non-hydrolyzing) [Steroidobacteraceae bacterium]|jgi:UDP-GlcNAc3NAcA epimerase|nr:UDP-N-acetylglucosamine 2-epimerase (non-hydrolyzing) [Steroidobacteraceae bacterium]